MLQLLRRHRYPVSGAALADELGVSLRTLYRDIAALQAQGAQIVGEPGLGYVLKPGFMLPPLMFTEEEIEALVLGSRWVARRADGPLAQAARTALSKIAAVLPPELRDALDASPLLVGPATGAASGPPAGPAEGPDRVPGEALNAPPVPPLEGIRRAIRMERKLELRYRDGRGAETVRTVWPFALAFFEQVRVVVAWCEQRQDFRSFRADRIREVRVLPVRYPRRRQALLGEWRAIEGIPSP